MMGVVIPMTEKAKDGTPEQQAQIEQTLDILTTKPETLPRDVQQQLLTSMQDGTFVETLDGLSDNEAFQKALFSNRPPALNQSPLLDRPPGPF